MPRRGALRRRAAPAPGADALADCFSSRRAGSAEARVWVWGGGVGAALSATAGCSDQCGLGSSDTGAWVKRRGRPYRVRAAGRGRSLGGSLRSARVGFAECAACHAPAGDLGGGIAVERGTTRRGDGEVSAVEISDYFRILRSRWKLVVAVIAAGVLVALSVSLLTTPKYAATTQLFVSTTGQDNTTSAYQGGLFSQQRVTSYSELIKGREVAQRVVDALRLPVSASDVSSGITVKVVPDTVILQVTVTDPSPERARDVANTLAIVFTQLVSELETPQGGATAATKVTVVQQADLPTMAVSPNTRQNVAFGAVLGLLIGLGLALLRDRLDKTVKSRQEVVDSTGASVVGAIPYDSVRPEQPLVSFGEGHSASAEAFRQVRTNLQFLDVDNPPHVVVVTSALPNEGKTTTALNLAFAIGEAGHRVLLVEADLRRPRLARYLRLVENVGLTNVLSGTAELDDVLQPTSNLTVELLAAGPHPPNPSELLGSSRLQDLLADLRTRYDYIIFDAPPLLPVTDAAVLTVQADGAILVARHGHTERDKLARATENLRSVDGRVLGTILNMVPVKSNGYDYAYYYETEPRPAASGVHSPGDAPVGPALDADVNGAAVPDRAAKVERH
ncbi:polysaccharide biosynthesis tyrosine autokinase [Rhodococcus sp. X156]|uniref:polysaccharide biosynthesis tyrosine autokinase n=1 Tax=Rhodococcus sp. X156 TaxID=2499145 RepID=UPI001F49F6A4|nr:polysaccharide biosynthesis tyrosine autokinase [Rhodococcus sp. X156]